MSERLGERLSRQASESFVGRESELARLGEILVPGPAPLVVHLWGIAGVGKSTLLLRFAKQAREQGATVLVLDCRLIEPTARGFLGELGELVGSGVGRLEQAVAALERLAGPVVLALDHYESLRLLDSWLRQTLVPALPDTVRLVIASRQPPVPVWLTSPQWQEFFSVMAIEPLGPDEAMALLRDAGVEPEDARRLAAVTHGNPLALRLAASAALARPELALEDAAIQQVMQELTSLFLADVEDDDAREAIQATSVARRITESLLRALGLGGGELWQSLRRIPFVDARRDGLRIHDAVREAIALSWRSSDPERYRQCRSTIWGQLRGELRAAGPAELWRYTADMLYLIENPVVREAFFPSEHRELAVEPALAADRERIHQITARHDGEEAAAILDSWWDELPQAFRVARDREEQVVAFYCMAEAGALTARVKHHDPVAATWARHLRDEPLPESATALLLRRWLGEGPGEAPSAEQAACWLDVKRIYMEMRPGLRRVYLTVVDLPTYAPVATELGFEHLAEAALEIDGRAFQTAMLDFGPASVDGWLTRLVANELGLEEDSLLDRDRRALLLDGRSVSLTPLEFKLLEYLEARLGATATRDELLNDVWGHGYSSGSSNVVDAVVKSLRGKMGTDARRIETVRGFGYRLRAS